MDQQNDYARIIAKAWADEDFKARLVADPAATLAGEGIEVPTGVNFRVVVDDEGTSTIVIPPPPAEGEISEHSLEQVSGGFCCSSFSDFGLKP